MQIIMQLLFKLNADWRMFMLLLNGVTKYFVTTSLMKVCITEVHSKKGKNLRFDLGWKANHANHEANTYLWQRGWMNGNECWLYLFPGKTDWRITFDTDFPITVFSYLVDGTSSRPKWCLITDGISLKCELEEDQLEFCKCGYCWYTENILLFITEQGGLWHSFFPAVTVTTLLPRLPVSWTLYQKY